MARTIESFKLRTQIEVDNAKASSALKATEKDVDKLGARFTKLGPEITKSMKGVEAGKGFGAAFSSGATSIITADFKSLGQTLGSIIGTVVLPGLGTAIGSTVGSAVDAATAKVAGMIGPLISRGIELNELMERSSLHFKTFIGDEKAAGAHMEFLKRQARDAFDLKTFIDASQRMEEFTDDVGLTELALKAASDQAAAFGGSAEKFDLIVNSLGLMAETGKLTERQLKSLAKTGVDVTGILAEAFGASRKKIEQLMAAGRIRGEVAAGLIAEGIEKTKGGYAGRVSAETGFGRKGTAEALLGERAAEGTRNITQTISDLNLQLIGVLDSPAAQKFVAFIDQTAGALVDTAKKGITAGVNLAQGLAGGIESGTPGVINAITNVGSTAIQTLTNLWGMQSPSRVFAQMGSYAVDGLENGLVDRTAQGFDRWAEALEKAGGEAFIRGVAGIAKRIGVDPAWLLNVMSFESGFNPKAANPHSSGRGLIQFMDPTARALGFSSSSQITGLSAKQQLPLVEQYFKPFAGKMKNQGDVYAAVAAGRLPGPSGVLFRKGSKEYGANKVWDVNRDDVITAEEIGKLASRKGGFSSKAGPGNSDWSVRAVAQVMDMAGQMTQLTADGRPVTAANPLPVKIQNVNDLIKNTNDLILSTSKIATGEGDPIKNTQAAIAAASQIAVSLPQVSAAAALTAESLPPVVAGMKDLEKEIPLTAEQLRKLGWTAADTVGQLAGAIGSIGGLLPSQQVGHKRSFFSKLLGVAAPFLSFIPGVGGILSTIAGMASGAVGGNFGAIATGLSSGLQPGGVFRRTGTGSSGGGGGGGLAAGGRVGRGRSYLVGEYRPELFVPDSDGRVYPRVQGGDTSGAIASLEEAIRQLHSKIGSMRPGDVVTAGARGLTRAMDNDAGLIRLVGQRMRLA